MTTVAPLSPDRSVAANVRAISAHLAAHGSAEHAAGVQWFFKEAVRSYGWYTAPLRAYARSVHGALASDPAALVGAAGALFARPVLEEKILAVTMLQPSVRHFGAAEFRRFEGWLAHVSSWADHDALAMCLIGPLMAAHPPRSRRVFVWARSRSRWHRRASAVALIHGVRHGGFTAEATRITRTLATDDDDMVQKGLGWLLREWGKVRPEETEPLLLAIRGRTSRLVLRTACERLPAAARARVLGRASTSSS
jgi:3-methyladenine DNA glycosylase AlkD